MRNRLPRSGSWVALALALLPAGAHAVPIGTTVSIGLGSNNYEIQGLGTVTPIEPGLDFWQLNDQLPGEPGLWTDPSGVIRVDGMSAVLKEDPFVLNNLTITNISGITQFVSTTVFLPIPGGFAYSAIIDSSVGITITDSITSLGGAPGDGATISSIGPAGIYSGLVNGVTELTLFPHPTTISCASNGCSTSLSDPLGGDFDGPAGPGVATSIAITLTFALGPGDSAGITSRFEIIPEPATLALLGAGLAGIAAIGRRRRSWSQSLGH